MRGLDTSRAALFFAAFLRKRFSHRSKRDGMKPYLSRAIATQAAQYLIAAIAPGCHRVEVVGSLRRGKQYVSDVELLIIPRIEREPREQTQQTLFGGVVADEAHEINRFELRLSRLLDQFPDRLALNWDKPANGPRYKRLRFYADATEGQAVERLSIPVDLFTVLPPAQWGALYAIRTGDWEFSKLLVTHRSQGGLCPDDRYFLDGALRDRRTSEVIPTETEEDLFSALGLPYVHPTRRNHETARQLVRRPEWSGAPDGAA